MYYNGKYQIRLVRNGHRCSIISVAISPPTVIQLCSAATTAPATFPVHGAEHYLQGPTPEIHLPPPSKAGESHPSTPINMPTLSKFLLLHPDPCFVDHLITGLSQGFRVGVLSPLSANYVAKNLQSALAEPKVVVALRGKKVGDACYIRSDFILWQGSSGHTPPKWLSLGPSDTGHG
ncbi:hypothetical protein N1851_026914 [Merluccius polli]|uniref:Uncharacterized protein n=1 Tax=Merluccius polli TaxID=89951 RepID=A0AA47MB87_MERPO|nr:hypothetical protein N1851_026914 [Merluccius polli]